MLISSNNWHLATRFGDEKAIEIFSQAGFDAIDYSCFHLPDTHPLHTKSFREYALRLKSFAEESGIFFNQAHAPHPTYKEKDEDFNKKTFDRILRSIEFASLLGAKTMIVHPAFLPEDKQAQKELNLEFYESLRPHGKEFGIEIALENMWIWNDKTDSADEAPCSSAHEFCEYVDMLGDGFTACVDIGHAEMMGDSVSAVDMIKTLGGERMTCMHLHDNDKHHDLHTMPYLGKIDWPPVMKALKEIKYGGFLTFEAGCFFKNFPLELCTEAAKLMLNAGKMLSGLFEES